MWQPKETLIRRKIGDQIWYDLEKSDAPTSESSNSKTPLVSRRLPGNRQGNGRRKASESNSG